MADDNLTALRRRKIAALAALGLPVYNVDFRPDHTMDQALRELEAWEMGPAAAGRSGFASIGSATSCSKPSSCSTSATSSASPAS
jgi:hypothetical protein